MTSNFERFQEIQKQADSESYSSICIWEPKKCQMSGIHIWESCSPLCILLKNRSNEIRSNEIRIRRELSVIWNNAQNTLFVVIKWIFCHVLHTLTESHSHNLRIPNKCWYLISAPIHACFIIWNNTQNAVFCHLIHTLTESQVWSDSLLTL